MNNSPLISLKGLNYKSKFSAIAGLFKTLELAPLETEQILKSAPVDLQRLSEKNILLVLCQKPNASQVKGFKQWREHDRKVKKGSSAIWILAPMTRKQKDTNPDDQEYELKGFKLVMVFDISDTEPLADKCNLSLQEVETWQKI